MVDPQGPSQPESPDTPGGYTSIHLRKAIDGNADSLEWIIARLSPLLLANAEYRLGPQLRTHCDPEDLVHDTWLVALPRMAELATRGGRHTPVLLRFLTTTLLYRINELARKHLRRSGARRVNPDAHTPEGPDTLSALPAATSGVISVAIRKEIRVAVTTGLEELGEQDREIIHLRGIEQHPIQTVAVMLALSPSAVTMRYRRALARLRSILPGSVFDELLDE